MDIMVVGGGGREHAIIKKLKENKKAGKIYALPGNGGIASDALCVDIKATDLDAICSFAAGNNISFAVVAPDDPLVMGLVDRLEDMGIKCFGPNKKAAQIEGSKAFSKGLMKKYDIPTAGYEEFSVPEEAKKYIRAQGKFPVVIKADGLALGKGVIIAQDEPEAFRAVDEMLVDRVFGDSGSRIIIEEYMTGPEVSVLAFTDGRTIVPMVSSTDHKRALDGDNGLNTGGMGTIAPSPYYSVDTAAVCMEKIFVPTIEAMNAEGRRFKGCLYFGLMITGDGPKVIEYNCRFGDPETQVVLPLLKTDLLEIMEAVAEERLENIDVVFSPDAACCVIAASGGYPQACKKGLEIKIEQGADVILYHAGTALRDGALVTSGGRVAGVTAVACDLETAVKKAYDNINVISFEDMYYRKDIGKKALAERN